MFGYKCVVLLHNIFKELFMKYLSAFQHQQNEKKRKKREK